MLHDINMYKTPGRSFGSSQGSDSKIKENRSELIILMEGNYMKKLEELQGMLNELNEKIGAILRYTEFRDYEDLSAFDINSNSADQLMLWDEFRMILERMDFINDRLNYLNVPVLYEGTLSKNEQGRYQLPNGKYYTSGSLIECLICDGGHDKYNEDSKEYENVPYWARTSVEHDGNDYYLVSYKNIPMQGLRARVRR